MPDVALAVVGGSVGVLLTWAARSVGIPYDVGQHDAAVAERDAQLATWVADRDHVLRGECQSLREPVNVRARHQTDPEEAMRTGETNALATLRAKADVEIAAARGRALHEYRDQVRLAEQDVARIAAVEGSGHRAWRWARRKPFASLGSPDKAQPVIDSWRQPSRLSERPVWPDDATARTLDAAVAAVTGTGP